MSWGLPAVMMRPVRRSLLAVLAGVLLLGLAVAACGDSSADSEATAPQEMVDSGSWYVKEAWPHDGAPIESEHFVVYSDSASAEARRGTAGIAEEVWSGLQERFAVAEEDLVFPPGRDRIDIYTYRNRFPERHGMRAYQAGLIAWSLDHSERPTDRNHYSTVIEHELVHVLETLLKGRDPTIEPMTDAWFSEGLAEAVVRGSSGGPVRGRDQLAELLAAHGGQNPIALKRDNWYDAVFEFHYPMFQLAVEYLLDPEGGGRTLEDARDLFLDMADGTTFEEAFGRHMGMPLDTYEANFFSLMDGYLPPYRNVVFTPVGIALLALLIVGPSAAVLVVSGRRNCRAAPTAARIGFYASTGLGWLVSVAATFGILVVLGTGANLYNEFETAGRHQANWLMTVFFLSSVAILVWVQRRWARGSRLAYLGLPLVAPLTALAIIVASAVL